jgi:hypothetical protein
LAPSPLRPTTRFFFQLNTYGYIPYVTFSLTRGWVYRLQLLLVLASAVIILRSESRGTHDHILLSQIRDSPNLEGQVSVFLSPRKKVTRLTPRHWVPFSSPPTTRRSTVEAFEPASTRESELIPTTRYYLYTDPTENGSLFSSRLPSNRSLLLLRGPPRKHLHCIVDRRVCGTVYRAVAWQRSNQIRYIAPSLRLLVPSSLKVCHRSLLSEVSCSWRLLVARFLLRWPFSNRSHCSLLTVFNCFSCTVQFCTQRGAPLLRVLGHLHLPQEASPLPAAH